MFVFQVFVCSDNLLIFIIFYFLIYYNASKFARLLCSVLKPPPAILVLGGGLDAPPVVRFAAELGWKVTLQDHRPGYIEAGDLEL